MGAEQLRQRQSGALGFHIPQGNIKRRDGLYRHAAAPDGGARPQQFGVDLVDIVGVFAEQIIGNLFGMGVNSLASRALGIAKAYPFETVAGADFGDDNRDFGERFLPPGEDFGIADRRG